MEGQYEIEKAACEEFLAFWEQGTFEQQRLGQAFYNHFRLHALTDQASLHQLYEAGEREAIRLISSQFLIR